MPAVHCTSKYRHPAFIIVMIATWINLDTKLNVWIFHTLHVQMYLHYEVTQKPQICQLDDGKTELKFCNTQDKY